MTFDHFIEVAFEYARRHPKQRFGQACMNALRWNRADLWGKVGIDIWEAYSPNNPAVFHWFYELEQLW